jgi:flavodoxin
MASVPDVCVAFSPLPSNLPSSSLATALFGSKVGIFFGTSTGSTEEVAHLISGEFGSDVASEPIEIDSVADTVASEFAKYDALVVGTPTWNTGADQEVRQFVGAFFGRNAMKSSSNN